MMPRTKTGEGAIVEGKFNGRTISKSIYNIGIGGELQRTADDPELPPECEIEFAATAKFSAFKGKFTEDGKVVASYILTIDPDTFRIVAVTEAPPPVQPPLDEGGE